MADTLIKLCDGPSVPRGLVYLPIVTIHSTPGPQPVEPIEPAEVETPTAAFLRLLMDDERQQRKSLLWSTSLAAAAMWKALDIADHNYWSHRASTGEMPNFTARRMGCNLPAAYGDSWNGVESLCAGSPNAAPILEALGTSASHRPHIWGENEFFRQQTHVGVAMVRGGQWGWIWAIYLGTCGK